MASIFRPETYFAALFCARLFGGQDSLLKRHFLKIN